MTEFYSTGTIAVTNGSVDFVGTGTTWLPVNAKAGDALNVAGNVMLIGEITDGTNGKFSIPYPGATASGLAYAIAKTSSEWGTNRTLSLQTAELIAALAAGATEVSFDPPSGMTADDVQAAIEELFGAAYTKSETDTLVASAATRGTVRAATTANITISTALNNGDTLDGVALANGDLVLVKNQSTPAENGVYVVGAVPARAAQFDTYNEHPGSLIVVQEGTANADSFWYCTSNKGGTLGTTAIGFSQLSLAPPDGSVTLAKLANLANATVIGRSTAGTGVPEVLTMTSLLTLLYATNGLRTKLTAARTYYVRPDGSDSNNGLSNTAGGAFLTRQKAMDVIADTLDIGNYDVMVQIADATYTDTLRLKTYVGSAGRVKFIGNTTTPANVLFSTTGTTAVATADNGVAGVFELRGFKAQTTTSGDCISIAAPRAIVFIGNIDFGTCAGTQLNASFGALVYYLASLAVSGNAVIGFCADREATVFLSGGTIVYSNSPVYSARNFQFTGGGTLDVYGMTFTNGGTVTGKRYEGDSLGRCFTNGGGASYVPGNSAGSIANGAIYH